MYVMLARRGLAWHYAQMLLHSNALEQIIQKRGPRDADWSPHFIALKLLLTGSLSIPTANSASFREGNKRGNHA
jgi:hypothetical protein